MSPKRRTRKINPTVFVFCEGETEQRYIDILQQSYRVPIQIVTKVLNTKISTRIIDSHIKNCGYPEVDRVFLFYDGDRDDIVERLYSISGVEIMLSCPCVELWFLLHFAEHHVALNSDGMVKALRKYFPEYKKGQLQGRLAEVLIRSWRDATKRAKNLESRTNPSSTAYLLPEYIESIKCRQ